MQASVCKLLYIDSNKFINLQQIYQPLSPILTEHKENMKFHSSPWEILTFFK